jgi:uncharacterized linocin/CFP29 family protein
MNDLRRELAPISDAAWREIDAEARRTLKTMLAARKLVDFTGPLGWEASAVGLGRVKPLKLAPEEHVLARIRQVQPMVELRAPFTLRREELDAIGRGAPNPDLDPLIAAARAAALSEDHAVFHGFADAQIQGLAEAGAGSRCTIREDYGAYPAVVAEALNKLRHDGIDGPFAIALGPRCYAGLTTGTLGGYPILEHVRRLLDGPLVWAPAVNGALVVSLRGGDAELVVGQDWSIGYLDHDATDVRLYLQETFTFRVLTPEAAVPLVYPED